MPRYTIVHEERDEGRAITVAVTDTAEVRLSLYDPTLGEFISWMSEHEAERIGFAMLEAANTVKAASYLPVDQVELVRDEHGEVIGVRLV